MVTVTGELAAVAAPVHWRLLSHVHCFTYSLQTLQGWDPHPHFSEDTEAQESDMICHGSYTRLGEGRAWLQVQVELT